MSKALQGLLPDGDDGTISLKNNILGVGPEQELVHPGAFLDTDNNLIYLIFRRKFYQILPGGQSANRQTRGAWNIVLFEKGLGIFQSL